MGIALNICLTRAVLTKYVVFNATGRKEKVIQERRQTHDLKVGMLDQ